MSNRKFLCFSCRVCVRREAHVLPVPRCHHCGGETVNIGYRIPVPPKSAIRQWRALQQHLAVTQAEHAQAAERAAVRRVHDLEKELSRLTALSENPGRRALMRRLSRELAKRRVR